MLVQDLVSPFASGSAHFVLGPPSGRLAPVVPRWHLPASHRAAPAFLSHTNGGEERAFLSSSWSLTGPEWVHVLIPQPSTVARGMGRASWLSLRVRAPTLSAGAQSGKTLQDRRVAPAGKVCAGRTGSQTSRNALQTYPGHAGSGSGVCGSPELVGASLCLCSFFRDRVHSSD